MPELKPCRICGIKPKVTALKGDLNYFKVAIQCQKCKIEIEDESNDLERSKRKLFNFWNNDQNWKQKIEDNYMDKDIQYVSDVLSGNINAPMYVRKQCAVYKHIFENADKNYCINLSKRNLIIEITKLLKIPRGLSAGKTVFETLSGFQWLFIFAVLTVVYRSDTEKRRFETGILEICRKNGKTFLVAVIFLQGGLVGRGHVQEVIRAACQCKGSDERCHQYIFIYFLCLHNDKFFRGLESKVEAHGDGAALRIDTIVDTQRSGSCAVA